MAQWYYALGGKQNGPVSAEKLQQLAAARELQPADLVWTDGMPQWTPLAKVPGLLPAGAADQHDESDEKPARRGLSGSAKVGLATAGGGGAILLLLTAIVLIYNHMQGNSGPAPAVHEKRSAEEKPKAKDPELKVYAFDPAMLTTKELKEAFAKGQQAGEESADDFEKQNRGRNPEAMKLAIAREMRAADTAIQVPMERYGAASPDTILWFGAREGFKKGLARHGLSTP